MIATEYDRLRPSPPAAFVDDLVALAPKRVLDIGCGTGKVAKALAARGLSVLGVELDPRMAALAGSRSRSRPSRNGTTPAGRST